MNTFKYQTTMSDEIERRIAQEHMDDLSFRGSVGVGRLLLQTAAAVALLFGAMAVVVSIG